MKTRVDPRDPGPWSTQANPHVVISIEELEEDQ